MGTGNSNKRKDVAFFKWQLWRRHENVFLQRTNLPEVVHDGEGHEEGVVGGPGDEAAHPHHQVQSTLESQEQRADIPW